MNQFFAGVYWVLNKKPPLRGQDFWVKGVVGEDHVSIFFEVTYPGYMYYVVLVP